MRATRKHLAAALVCSAIAPLFLTGVATAQDAIPTGDGSVSGLVWQDTNSNGLIDAGEPGIAGHQVTLLYYDPAVPAPGVPVVTTTAADGSYRFENLPHALYEVEMANRLEHGQTFTATGGDSRFRSYGRMGSPFTIDEQFKDINRVNAGFTGGSNDYRASRITLSPSKETYQVGDVVEIVGGVHYEGPHADLLGARLTLPKGLTKLNRLGDMYSTLAEAEPATVLEGMMSEASRTGEIGSTGARFRIDQPIDAGRITLEVLPGHFGVTDPDPANNTTTVSLTAVAAPVAPAPTTDPATGPVDQPVGDVTSPAPTSGSSAATSTSTSTPTATPVAQATGSLASTGASPVGLIALAGALLTAGVAAFGLSRRRRAKA